MRRRRAARVAAGHAGAPRRSGGLGAMLLLAAAAAWDAFASRRAWRRAAPRMTRRLPPAFAIGVRQTVHLVIEIGERRGGPDARWRGWGAAWRASTITPTTASLTEGLPITLTLAAGKQTEISYTVTPSRRGEITFAPADVRVRSRWGLWELLERLGPTETAPRLSGLRAGRALRLAGRRSAAAGNRHQDLSPARAGHRLQTVVGISRRRSGASHRLEGDAAPRQADRARVSGRSRSVRAAADRLRPPHASRRSRSARWARRTSIRC